MVCVTASTTQPRGFEKDRTNKTNKIEMLVPQHRTVGLQWKLYHIVGRVGAFVGTITNSANPFQRTVLEQLKQDTHLPEQTT